MIAPRLALEFRTLTKWMDCVPLAETRRYHGVQGSVLSSVIGSAVVPLRVRLVTKKVLVASNLIASPGPTESVDALKPAAKVSLVPAGLATPTVPSNAKLPKFTTWSELPSKVT